MSPAEKITAYLAAQGVGLIAPANFGTTDSDWALFTAMEPSAPGQVITVYDTGGEDPDTDEQNERPTILIRVRSKKYEVAYAKHEAIRALLIGPSAVSGMLIFAMGNILALGRDENNAHLLTANYRALNL